MLTFLRKIRKSLVESGGTGKYLIYAVGEILLVVIGILIALQINNWNEWRKDREIEKEVLSDIYSDFERNSEAMTKLIQLNTQNNESADRIISLIQNKQFSVDSLPLHFHRARMSASFGLFLSKAGYESLKNTGFNIIRNDTLMDMILNLYEVVYPQHLNFVQTVVQPVFSKGNNLIDNHFVTEEGGLLTPLNLNSTLNEVSYSVFLKRARTLRNAMNRHTQRSLTETTKAFQMVKHELGDQQ